MATVSTASRRSPVRNWSDLPDGPLYTILTCLYSFVDFISFSSVCRSWRAVASSLSPSQITSLFPPLLLRSPFTDLHQTSTLRLLAPASPSLNRSLSRSFRRFYSVGYGFLSSHGCLFRLLGDQIVILEPFKHDKLYSPILPYVRWNGIPDTFPLHTSTVSFTGSALLLFTSRTLFHWRIGSPTWSRHSIRIKPRPTRPIIVATVKEKVYAMDSEETLFVVDFSPELRLRKLAVDGIREESSSYRHFLVDCGGELLLLRLVSTEVGEQLEALRLDLSANGAVWVKKESLGNWAIFVGYDRRLPGLAVENPERWGGRSNCVYFAPGNGNVNWPWAVIKLGEKIGTWNHKSPRFIGEFSRNRLAVWVHPGFYF